MESGFALFPCIPSKIIYINAGILGKQGLVSPLLQLDSLLVSIVIRRSY